MRWTLVIAIVGWLSVGARADGDPPPPPACPKEPQTVQRNKKIPVPAGFDGLALYDVASKEVRTTPKLENGFWTVSLDDLKLRRASTETTTIQLRWTVKGNDAAACLQPFVVPPHSVVREVACDRDPCGIGDRIKVTVQDLDEWLDKRAKDPQNTISALVPFFDGLPLRGVHPENPDSQAYFENYHSFRTLEFTLERNATNKDIWSKLLNGREWDGRPFNLSVGFETGDPVFTFVLREPPQQDGYSTFKLAVIPHAQAVIGLVVLILALVAFILLARSTTILRDPTAPLRPDGRAPYSLARCQMAFWFFLVVSSWFLLFLVIKDFNTITDSVLALLGISAGTAVGSAILDAGRAVDDDERDKHVTTKTKLELEKRLVELDGQIKAATDPADKKSLTDELAIVRRQKAFVAQSRFLHAMHDLLGDNGQISFHRFQIAVWTLVLGLVFGLKVLGDLAMPDFSGTLLGLMGISSATYLGYKLPAAGGPAK